MKSQNNIAFKEWAIVCRAIAEGRQTLILRKGGIAEKRGGFEVEHREFFLFPTLFHQQNDAVLFGARAELTQIAPQFYPDYNNAPSQVTRPTTAPLSETVGRVTSRGEPSLGHHVSLSLYAVVEDVQRLTDWERVRALAPFHIWKEETIKDRFGWGRANAITLIIARFYRLPSPVTIPLRDSYGGCTSWVELEERISVENAQTVLSNAEFAERAHQINSSAV